MHLIIVIFNCVLSVYDFEINNVKHETYIISSVTMATRFRTLVTTFPLSSKIAQQQILLQVISKTFDILFENKFYYQFRFHYHGNKVLTILFFDSKCSNSWIVLDSFVFFGFGRLLIVGLISKPRTEHFSENHFFT